MYIKDIYLYVQLISHVPLVFRVLWHSAATRTAHSWLRGQRARRSSWSWFWYPQYTSSVGKIHDPCVQAGGCWVPGGRCKDRVSYCCHIISIYLLYALHIPCIYHVYQINLNCIYRKFRLDIHCICRAYLKYIVCISIAYYILWIHYVYQRFLHGISRKFE